jgi:HSP20 family protein
MANIVRRNEGERGVSRREQQFQFRDPFRSIADLMRLPFEDLERTVGLRPAFIPDVDLRESSDAYLLEADLPGFKQEDVEITVTGDRLTITGRREPREEDRQYLMRERPAGEFVRNFSLPTGTDPDNVRADLRDGVLSLTIPKRPEVQARKINLGKGTADKSSPPPAQAAPPRS